MTQKIEIVINWLTGNTNSLQQQLTTLKLLTFLKTPSFCKNTEAELKYTFHTIKRIYKCLLQLLWQYFILYWNLYMFH